MNKIDFKMPPCLAMLKETVVREDEPVTGAQINVDCLGVPDDDFFSEAEDTEGENLDSKNKCEGKCAKSYREDCKPDIE